MLKLLTAPFRFFWWLAIWPFKVSWRFLTARWGRMTGFATPFMAAIAAAFPGAFAAQIAAFCVTLVLGWAVSLLGL
ncbi:hypothetical protein BH09ACT10_BH09ACT10_26280 [soil metagenome]